MRNAKETVDTTLFRCNREVRAELNGHTTLDQTPFGLASGVPKESPRCSCAWRGMLCLGYASSGEEGIVSEVTSRSRMRLSRHDGGHPAWGCGRFWCPCVGATCGQENCGPGWSCGVGPTRSPGATPGGPCGGGLGGRVAGAARGPRGSWRGVLA